MTHSTKEVFLTGECDKSMFYLLIVLVIRSWALPQQSSGDIVAFVVPWFKFTLDCLSLEKLGRYN